MKKLLFSLLLISSLVKADVPPPPAATTAEVAAGTITSKYVSPFTLLNSGVNVGLTANEVSTQIASSNLITSAQATAAAQAWGTTGTVASVSQSITSNALQQASGFANTNGNTASQISWMNNNGKHIPPTQGWSTYLEFGGSTLCSESNVWYTETNLMSDGLFQAGYTSVKLENSFFLGRNLTTGYLTNDLTNFPDGGSNFCWKLRNAGCHVWVNNIILPRNLSDMTNDILLLKNYGIEGYQCDLVSPQGGDNNERFIQEGYYQISKSLYPSLIFSGWGDAQPTTFDPVLADILPWYSTNTYNQAYPSWMLNEFDETEIQAGEWGVFFNGSIFTKQCYDFLLANAYSQYWNANKHPMLQDYPPILDEISVKHRLASVALWHSGNFGSLGGAFTYTNVLFAYTNAIMLSVLRDPPCNNPTKILDNGTNLTVWSETLSDGRIFLLVVNDTNISQTVTIPILSSSSGSQPAIPSWGTPTIPNGQGYLVKDVFATPPFFANNQDAVDMNGFWATNSFKFTTITNLQETNLGSYFLELIPGSKFSYGNNPYLAGKNLIAKFSFNTNNPGGFLKDDSVFSWPLNLYVGTQTVTNGIADNALYFDGNSTYIVGGYNSSTWAGWPYNNYGITTAIGQAITNGNWGISCWYNSTNVNSANAGIWEINQDGNDVTEVVAVGTNALGFYTATGSFSYVPLTFSGKTFGDGAWHHLVMTCSGGVNLTATLDVTNIVTGTWTLNPTFYSPTFAFYLGQDLNGNKLPVGTRLDEFYMYNRTLSSNDVYLINQTVQSETNILTDWSQQLISNPGNF